MKYWVQSFIYYRYSGIQVWLVNKTVPGQSIYCQIQSMREVWITQTEIEQSTHARCHLLGGGVIRIGLNHLIWRRMMMTTYKADHQSADAGLWWPPSALLWPSSSGCVFIKIVWGTRPLTLYCFGRTSLDTLSPDALDTFRCIMISRNYSSVIMN